MKKKIIPFGIALVIGASVLAGCGGADSGGNSGSAASGDASASEATVLIKFNTEGFGGQIAYDDEGKKVEFDDAHPYQSGFINAKKGSVVLIGAKADDGAKFVKWTKDGKEFSTEMEIKVIADADAGFVAVFE